MKRLVLLLSVAIMAGCSQAPAQKKELRLPETAAAGPEAKALLSTAWPKVRQVCPGLDKYSDSLTVVRVDDLLGSQGGDYRKVTVELLVAEGASSVPGEYKAMAHHCFLDINPDGKQVAIAKRPCKAVCLDRNIYNTEHDNGNELVLYFK